MDHPTPWHVVPKRVSFKTRFRMLVVFLIFLFFYVGISTGTFLRDHVFSGRPSSRERIVAEYLPTSTVSIKGKNYILEIANTNEAREQGLSDRPSLAPDHGMLFIFNPPVQFAFWMPRMHFPLDIVFLREGKIVDFVKNLPAPAGDEPPARYQPTEAYDQALEVVVGTIDALGLKRGDSLAIPSR